MLLFAAGHGIVSTLLGYWLSHASVLNTSASGAITVAGFAIFLVSWLLAPKHGLVMQAVVRRRLRRTIAMENLLKTVEELGSGAPVSESNVKRELGMEPERFEKTLARAIRVGWVRRVATDLILTDSGRERNG